MNQSVLVLTKPQTGLADLDQKVQKAKAEALPAGPTAWPVQASEEESAANPRARSARLRIASRRD